MIFLPSVAFAVCVPGVGVVSAVSWNAENCIADAGEPSASKLKRNTRANVRPPSYVVTLIPVASAENAYISSTAAVAPGLMILGQEAEAVVVVPPPPVL